MWSSGPQVSGDMKVDGLRITSEKLLSVNMVCHCFHKGNLNLCHTKNKPYINRIQKCCCLSSFNNAPIYLMSWSGKRSLFWLKAHYSDFVSCHAAFWNLLPLCKANRASQRFELYIWMCWNIYNTVKHLSYTLDLSRSNVLKNNTSSQPTQETHMVYICTLSSIYPSRHNLPLSRHMWTPS